MEKKLTFRQQIKIKVHMGDIFFNKYQENLKASVLLQILNN